jgi:hypothetical protein
MVGRLLEGVGQTDQLRLGEGWAGEGHGPFRSGFGLELVSVRRPRRRGEELSIEALNLFEVVESVLTSSLGRLAQFREEPRPRLARELLETFDLLGEMRKRSGRVAELIQRCDACQTPEGKVYFIFEAGKALKLLGETCQAGQRFESLAASCEEARAGLRTFAGTALVVEDFF